MTVKPPCDKDLVSHKKLSRAKIIGLCEVPMNQGTVQLLEEDHHTEYRYLVPANAAQSCLWLGAFHQPAATEIATGAHRLILYSRHSSVSLLAIGYHCPLSSEARCHSEGVPIAGLTLCRRTVQACQKGKIDAVRLLSLLTGVFFCCINQLSCVSLLGYTAGSC